MARSYISLVMLMCIRQLYKHFLLTLFLVKPLSQLFSVLFHIVTRLGVGLVVTCLMTCCLSLSFSVALLCIHVILQQKYVIVSYLLCIWYIVTMFNHTNCYKISVTAVSNNDKTIMSAEVEYNFRKLKDHKAVPLFSVRA